MILSMYLRVFSRKHQLWKNIIISGVSNPENIIIDGSENGSVIVGSGIFFNSITIEMTIQNGVSVNGEFSIYLI